MEVILKGATSALLAYTTHYGMTKFYNYVCIPDGVWGYLYGMVSTGSPVCQAGIQILSSTQVSYSSMITMGIMRVVVDIVAPVDPVPK
jgi:hypothetical protein